MLNRITTNTGVSSPRGQTSLWQHELFSGSASWLPRLVALLIVGCMLTSVYLWQASAISTMRTEAMQLRHKAALLERENASLMLQVARWNSPGYIETKAIEQGLRDAPPPIRVRVVPTAEPGENTNNGPTTILALWQRLTAWPPGAGISSDATKTTQAR
jgi:hypothetical protein